MRDIFQERQAAYQQARERIFGKFSPEEETESEADLGPTLVPLPPTTVNSPTGMLQPRMQFSAPVPRPRAPVAALRTIRAPHFQPIPACQDRLAGEVSLVVSQVKFARFIEVDDFIG
uniref:SUZ domain-containing protein n=1 Tax=Parascaris equorum TaxID=6256 RepID=A0A914S1W1_PAREQ